MTIAYPIFISDSVERIYGDRNNYTDLQLASDGSALPSKRERSSTKTLNGVLVRAIYDPPDLYMTKTDTLDSDIFHKTLTTQSSSQKKYLAGKAKILIPSKVFPMFRSEMKPGDRMTVNIDSLKFEYQVTEANGVQSKIDKDAVFCPEKKANDAEREYLKLLVVKHVLKPTDPIFTSKMLETSTKDLISFLNKAHPEPDKLIYGDDDQSETLLTTASKRNKWDVCFALLKNGAGPDIGHHGNSVTPLHLAAQARQSELLEELLAHGANPKMTTRLRAYQGRLKRKTALMYALTYKDKDDKEKSATVRNSMVQTLLESGAAPEDISLEEMAEFVGPLKLMMESLLVGPEHPRKYTSTQKTYQEFLKKLETDNSDIRKKLESDHTPEVQESQELKVVESLIDSVMTVPKLQNVCRAVIRSKLTFPISKSAKCLPVPTRLKDFICGRWTPPNPE